MDKFALSLTQAMTGDEWSLQFLLPRTAAEAWHLLALSGDHC